MARIRQRAEQWNRVTSGAFLFLSSVNPPDARASGMVIGPNSRVRPCDGVPPRSELEVLCLEVEQDGQIDRGYTIARMVAYRPEKNHRSWNSKRIAVGAMVGAASIVAGALALF
jgi:hypothetical protein